MYRIDATESRDVRLESDCTVIDNGQQLTACRSKHVCDHEQRVVITQTEMTPLIAWFSLKN